MVQKRSEATLEARSLLLRCLDEGVTGVIDGSIPGGAQLAVFVMGGEILVARSDQDDDEVLRRLRNNGSLDDPQVAEIRAAIDAGGSLAGLLQDRVPDAVVAQVLFERFRENLYTFLALPAAPTFTPLDAVFEENIQVGHDSRVLIDELTQLHLDLAPLERGGPRVLWPGQGTVHTDEQVRFIDLCGGLISQVDLLSVSPFEPNRTLDLVRRMLHTRMLETDRPLRDLARPGGEADAVPDPSGEPPRRLDSPRRSMVIEGDEHTEEVPRTAPRAGRTRPPVVSRDILDGGSARRGPVPAPGSVGPQNSGAPPRSLHQDISIDEELAAFGDYDYTRGDGGFVADRTTLDRVIIGAVEPAVAPPAAPEMVIEMEEGEPLAPGTRTVSLNFSGPRLADDEALQKIEVVSEVLATVVAALDEANGVGSGQARVQVLVEGTSGPYAAIFSHVELRPGGWLPTDKVLRNLKKRPAAEQRQLLNRALEDVVERALSLASSALDEAHLDRMLENIAGFQQRFGH